MSLQLDLEWCTVRECKNIIDEHKKFTFNEPIELFIDKCVNKRKVTTIKNYIENLGYELGCSYDHDSQISVIEYY